MNLDFDEAQLMLRTQAREFVTDKCPATQIKQWVLTDKGFSEDVWKEMGSLGWMSIPFPENYGGAGMSFFEALLILEELGRGAVPSPFVSHLVCGMALNQFGSEEQKQKYLTLNARGESIFAPAWTEPDASFEPTGIKTKAVKGTGPKYGITGTKLFCSDADASDYLLVVARTAEPKKDEPGYGITVFIAKGKDPAVICKKQDAIGFDSQCHIEMVNHVVDEKDILGELNKGWAIVEKMMSWGALCKCAEMIGGADKAFEMSIAYAQERVQYGKHIGSFQVTQHRAADMWLILESSRNYFYEIGWKVSIGSATPLEVSKCKAMISEMAEELTDKATRLHGAIGITWDYDLSLYFRRARGASLAYGDPGYHKAKIAAILEHNFATTGKI